MCDKAPSGAQKNLSSESGNFYSELHSAYATEFKDQTAILDNLKGAWTPILNGGINQQGFSPSELAALNSSAINSTAANYKSASAAVNEQLAARGGGNSFLPSGADAQINAGIATKAAQQLSTEQNQITQANYATGRQNFKDATGALTHVAAELNPNGTAGVAVGAGDSAFKQATQIYQENVANNAWKGQLINAGIGVAADFATGGLSGIFSSATKGQSSGDASAKAGFAGW